MIVLWPEFTNWDESKMAKKLGVSVESFEDLCYIERHKTLDLSNLSLSRVERHQAVKVLDNLIETGEVDWNVVEDLHSAINEPQNYEW